MTHLPRIATAALAAVLGLGAPMAVAQDGGQSGQQPPAVSSADVADAKIESFVQAADAIRSVMDEYRPQMQQVESQADRDALRQEVNDEIVAAVKATPGISLEEYVQIARAARNDKELEGRIREMMQGS